jgi:hypothetical protein
MPVATASTSAITLLVDLGDLVDVARAPGFSLRTSSG